MGIKRIEKIRREEIRARAGVTNVSQKIIVNKNEIVWTCREKTDEDVL